MAMAANKGLVSVRFIKVWKGYNPTDIAGFLPGQAAALVNSGVASYHKIEKPAVTPVTKVPELAPQSKKKVGKKSRKSKKKVTKVEAPKPEEQEDFFGNDHFRRSVKTALGVSTSTAYDANLNDIIDMASDSIRDHCGRIFRLQGYTETMPGDGSQFLKLKNYPIVEVSSVTLRGDAITDYEIADRDAGLLFRELGWEWTVAAGTWPLEDYPIPDGDLQFHWGCHSAIAQKNHQGCTGHCCFLVQGTEQG
jgi:hypothetical protein